MAVRGLLGPNPSSAKEHRPPTRRWRAPQAGGWAELYGGAIGAADGHLPRRGSVIILSGSGRKWSAAPGTKIVVRFRQPSTSLELTHLKSRHLPDRDQPHSRVRPRPQSLPSAISRKWHNRRLWTRWGTSGCGRSPTRTGRGIPRFRMRFEACMSTSTSGALQRATGWDHCGCTSANSSVTPTPRPYVSTDRCHEAGGSGHPCRSVATGPEAAHGLGALALRFGACDLGGGFAIPQ
jgi:hypothetical protein